MHEEFFFVKSGKNKEEWRYQMEAGQGTGEVPK